MRAKKKKKWEKKNARRRHWVFQPNPNVALVYAKINIIIKTAIINHNLSSSQNVTSWFEQ